MLDFVEETTPNFIIKNLPVFNFKTDGWNTLFKQNIFLLNATKSSENISDIIKEIPSVLLAFHDEVGTPPIYLVTRLATTLKARAINSSWTHADS